MRWRSGADSAGTGGPAPPERPQAPLPWAFTSCLSTGTSRESGGGRRLQCEEMASGKAAVPRWGSAERLQRGVRAGGSVWPCLVVSPAGDPGVGRGQGGIWPQLCVGEAAVSLPGLSGGSVCASPSPSQRSGCTLQLKGDFGSRWNGKSCSASLWPPSAFAEKPSKSMRGRRIHVSCAASPLFLCDPVNLAVL